MLEGVRAQLYALARRLRRLERRELDALFRWIEQTGNLLHVSVLVFVPLLIAVVTWLSNVTAAVSFLLFPPLASGTYTLFADPEGKYATPWKFVGGMTVGACCGWFALALTATLGLNAGGISTSGAAFSVLFTGICTWVLDLEEPTAFSTSLLVLVTGNAQFAYVLGIVVSSSFVAVAFVVWRSRFYEQRARYLYGTTGGDDHVLVPMADGDETVARFAASIASAHDAGKVVLFDVIDEATAERDDDSPSADRESDRSVAGHESQTSVDRDGETETTATERVASDVGHRLESLATDLEAAYGVPCEVVVAADGGLSAQIVLETARRQNCDLIVTPYAEDDRGALSSFIRGLFDSEIDVIAFRSSGEQRRWRHSLVAARGAGDTARAMLDFAIRVTETGRTVSVCTCIDTESRRRTAENTLANLVDAFSGPFETHVANASVQAYLSRVAPRYDVVFVGSSTDRSAASRFVSPPTFRKLRDLEADIAIVHRGRHR
ncbi:HPP family protein [Natrinema halophilum]|uniref:HPP family protein n=1 Tax=Natrinema halophilum TaxID=1699371 RepID=A0A7D5KTT8_9EURY|nr:HPP family protein [Natrinema halophilum]QLG50884.1 HPP family protein [Natrinema halophilum]